jgi:type I restriction enzyme, S subunit
MGGDKRAVVTIESLLESGALTAHKDGNYGSQYPRVQEFGSVGIPFLTAKSLKDGKIDIDGAPRLSEERANELRFGFVQPGDVLLSHNATIGRVAVVPKFEGRLLVGTSLTYFRVDPTRISPRYLAAYFCGSDFQNQLAAVMSLSTRNQVPITAQRHLHVVLPPIGEQNAIAHTLGTLDDKIEMNRRMNETLEAIADAIFRSWFVDFDPVRAKAEGRKSSLPLHGASGFPINLVNSELGPIPDSWEVGTLYDRASYINGLAFRSEDFSNGRVGLPVIKIGELKDGITSQTKFTLKDLDPKYRIKSGDILFAWSGSPDTSIDIFVWNGVDGWLNQHIFKIEVQHPEERMFVYFLLRFFKPIFIEIARNKQTTGLGHVTAQDLKRLKTPVPLKDALRAFNRIAEPLFQRAHWCRHESVNLCAIRDTFLPKLVTGEIRVKEAEGTIEARA